MAEKLILANSELLKLQENRIRSINLSQRRHTSRRRNKNKGLPYI